MVPFLKQVAAHYYATPDLGNTCFIFPNRRSMVFFRKYLSERVRGNAPMLAPPMYTINDFFCHLYQGEVSERLRLLLELYEQYKALNPKAEPLDEFIFWGEVMLSDFDDVDKYLADARSLYQNVSDFRALQDSFDYLTEGQKAAIEHFLAHFRDKNGGLRTDAVKSHFLQIWNLLFPLYTAFNASLRAKNMAYEGMVYRALAEKVKSGAASVTDLLEGEKYVFVGLNALNECERLLLRRMRDARVAEFVWDYVSEEIKDPAGKASFFMQRNVEEFPQAFPIEASGQPEVFVVSVPSAVGQAKLAPWILEQADGDPVETAFVLPDETLLGPLLNSLPPEHDAVNVTMGYPMSGSAVYTLVSALGQLQLRMRRRPDGWYYYHRQVREVFSSGLFRALLTEEEAEKVARVKADAKYYVPAADLAGGPLLDLLFRPVVTEVSVASARQNHALEAYLLEVVAFVGRKLTRKGDMLLEVDFAKRCHTQLNILLETDLEVLPATHLRILERILEGISVPFRGEPLQGLQVMGPLETRALDFRNLVILSANEGSFPRRSFQASFIPPELRKGFGLPTYEFQDAVWAYYFYRMIQRARKLWLVYDSRTEGLKNGEESRYIKQLEYHYHWKLKRFTAAAPIQPTQVAEDIPKTAQHVALIREHELSASTLQSYLACPVKFYYQVVEGLSTEDEVAESLDAGMLGNVFHHTMQRLYSGKTLVSRADIAAMQGDKARLKKIIREEVLSEMHSIEVSGRNLVLEEVILDYVQRTLSHDAALLASAGSEGFRIIGLEKKERADFEGFHFKGYIDRLDTYRPGQLRIVDYKTGKVEDAEVEIHDGNAAAVVEKLFGPVNKDRPKIALQLFLYDYFAAAYGQEVVNAIYSTARLYTGDIPEVAESQEFNRLVKERLKALLGEITDLSLPFKRTEELQTCAWCDFKNICGR
ncbi:MAG: PD-(D/E)XK nuclease family protein [Bacteroidales bacterium]|nr:PD-(D/E)XK nuclease family protein [Bacteroidales bacterium]